MTYFTLLNNIRVSFHKYPSNGMTSNIILYIIYYTFRLTAGTFEP